MHRSCSVTVLGEGPSRELLQKDHNGRGRVGGLRSACGRAKRPVEPACGRKRRELPESCSLLFRDDPNQWRSSDLTSLSCHVFGTRAGIHTAHQQRRGLRPRWPSAPVIPSRWPSAALRPPPGPSGPPGLSGRRAGGRRWERRLSARSRGGDREQDRSRGAQPGKRSRHCHLIDGSRAGDATVRDRPDFGSMW